MIVSRNGAVDVANVVFPRRTLRSISCSVISRNAIAATKMCLGILRTTVNPPRTKYAVLGVPDISLQARSWRTVQSAAIDNALAVTRGLKPCKISTSTTAMSNIAKDALLRSFGMIGSHTSSFVRFDSVRIAARRSPERTGNRIRMIVQ